MGRGLAGCVQSAGALFLGVGVGSTPKLFTSTLPPCNQPNPSSESNRPPPSLHFFKRSSQLLRHLSKCKVRHPPGEEIYRKDNVSMYEVGDV